MSDAERKTLAEIGKKLGKQVLEEIATIVKPDTILGWHCKLVAQKFDGSQQRKATGRPKVEKELEGLVVVTMADWGFLAPGQYLIHDRDSKYCPAFQRTIDAAGVIRVPLPLRSPNLNAYAERWVRSIKEETLSRFILFGERALRHALKQYGIHYHQATGSRIWSVEMEKQTLDKLAAAFEAVEHDLSGRVAELAAKSSAGTLSQEEQAEYEQIVRLNDLLSLLKLQAEEYWAPHTAS